MKKQFKTESKKMLDMMINSVYTHKEIFLRELISNASDAIDKRYFRALTDASLAPQDGYSIRIDRDKEARTLTITDNGCGMTEAELEKNLGTIAKSGSGEFKAENDSEADSGIDIIGQFGVGFYSAFMVCDKIEVVSHALGETAANKWESEGADGYTVTPCDYDEIGTKITLHIKDDTENDKYSEFLEEFKIKNLVKKYSDYIRYPIKTEVEKQRKTADSDDKDPKYETYTEIETLNSMVPLWHRNPSDITADEYNDFYKDKFFDYTEPAKVIHFKAEGTVSFEALLYIPKKAPMNYYSKNYEKGLQLYSSGVMITEKCESLLPDYFSFVKGLVDSPDLKLNISRETLQHDHQLKVIAKNIEKKIKSELVKMMKNDREAYEEFFAEFGLQIKYGIYTSYGMNKDLQDLLMYKSSDDKKYISLAEYTEAMPEGQKSIYYACAETIDAADMLPQTDAVKSKGYSVLYFTEEIDEFTISMLHEFDSKQFVNVCAENVDISTDEEKNEIKEINDKSEEMLKFMAESLGDSVSAVRFTNTLGDHPVCLSSEGGISTEMEKVLSKMPGAESEFKPKAETVLEINSAHPIAQKLRDLYETDKDKLSDCAQILYAQARLISGLTISNPTELSNKICNLML